MLERDKLEGGVTRSRFRRKYRCGRERDYVVRGSHHISDIEEIYMLEPGCGN